MINIFVLVTILGHLPVILSEKDKGGLDVYKRQDPDMVARTLGDRIAAYRCDYCKKIIVNYE